MPPPDNDYDFVPTDLMPPVGSKYLHHLFLHPEEYEGEMVAYLRIPKKIGGRLPPGQGWGINLVEGFIPHRIWVIILTLLLISLLFGIVWAAWKHDVQGAFGAASYIATVAGVAVGCLESCIG